MSGLNYNHLHYFWVVAREGHLTRAAERLHVSQSALSTQIRKFEDRLGQKLFDRQGRRLVLTEAGQIALDYADGIFSAGEEMLATLKSSERHSRQIVSVGALATLSRNFQIAFLEPLLANEDVELVLRSGSLVELMAELEAHRLDIVLVNQEPLRGTESRWIVHRVAEQPVSLVCDPARSRSSADARALLAEHPLILPSRHSGVRSAVDAYLAKQSITPAIAAEVDDMAMMRLLARENVGLAVLPPIVVRDELRSGRLVEAATLPGIVESFSAITLQRRFPNPLISLLVDAYRPEPIGPQTVQPAADRK